ncbi:MAG: DUF3995 domain-containing protein [Actinomycetia bacterium]|nr:DUF3995 domain-containing protein [Actinomycetes bacterium]
MMVWALVAVAGFLAAAALHVYWAAGGTWPGSDRSDLARKVVGSVDDFPSTSATLAVAALLLAAAVVVGGAAGLWSLPVPEGLVSGAVWVVVVVMLLRGIVGLGLSGLRQARGKGTPFSVRDVLIYSPLTLLLGGLTSVALLATT